jgi:ABC-2 type transport system ATP-binding protein
MRCEIAAALLHTPSVLFLDEPTIGLDAVSKLAVRDFVRQLNREHGVTVILTTHDMHDIEALAKRVIIIGNGRVLKDATFETVRNEVLRDRRLIVEFAGDISDTQFAGAEFKGREGRTCEFAFDPLRTPAHELIASIASRHEVVDIRIEDARIEEVIAHFYAMHGALES